MKYFILLVLTLSLHAEPRNCGEKWIYNYDTDKCEYYIPPKVDESLREFWNE